MTPLAENLPYANMPVPLDTAMVLPQGDSFWLPMTAEATPVVGAKASQVKEDNLVVPAPQMIPVPTSMVTPTPNDAYTTSFTPRPLPAGVLSLSTDFATADEYSSSKGIDAVMSEWSQWGPCSSVNTKQRTRTCIHDSINDGKPCGNTIETVLC